MASRLRVRPFLEHLEDRTVPATVKLIGGNLFVSNPLVTGGSASLTVTAKGTNLMQVQDGASVLGTYNVGGTIYITGSNAKDTITVNLNGNKFTGNLSINSGDGNDSITVTGTGAGNVIGGNVSIQHTDGNATINVNTTVGSTMTIGGSVTAVNTTNAFNTFHLGNAGSSAGSTFVASSPTTVGGNVTLTGFSDSGTTPAVQIGAGQQDSIGGSLSVTNTGNNNASVVLGAAVPPITQFQDNVGVTIGKGVSVQEGNGNDTFTILGSDRTNPAINLGTTINGNTVVSFGSGNDFFNVAGNGVVVNGGQQTVFNGNVLYTAGSGNDSINLAGGQNFSGVGTKVNGDLTVQLGDGNNDFGSAAKAGGSNGGFDFSEPVVTGNLNVTSGNGNNTMDFFGINVNGNDNFHFGNGNNGTAAAPILIRRPPGGTLNWTSGNGSDFLQLSTGFSVPQSTTFQVHVQFGNGDDTFELGGLANDQGGTISGTVDGGGRILGNVFIQNPNWVLTPEFTLSNFP